MLDNMSQMCTLFKKEQCIDYNQDISSRNILSPFNISMKSDNKGLIDSVQKFSQYFLSLDILKSNSQNYAIESKSNNSHSSCRRSFSQANCEVKKPSTDFSTFLSMENFNYSFTSNRYKTELCRPYEDTGICKYGSKCQFAHGINELRSPNRHPKYKTEPCRTFNTIGYCPYGPRCHFIHKVTDSSDDACDVKSSKSSICYSNDNQSESNFSINEIFDQSYNSELSMEFSTPRSLQLFENLQSQTNHVYLGNKKHGEFQKSDNTLSDFHLPDESLNIGDYFNATLSNMSDNDVQLLKKEYLYDLSLSSNSYNVKQTSLDSFISSKDELQLEGVAKSMFDLVINSDSSSQPPTELHQSQSAKAFKRLPIFSTLA